jgi:hypothetical protein
MLGVHLRGMTVVLMRMQCMTVRRMGMMRGFLVIACPGVLRRLAMVLCGVLVMIRSLLVVLLDIVIVHHSLPC